MIEPWSASLFSVPVSRSRRFRQCFYCLGCMQTLLSRAEQICSILSANAGNAMTNLADLEIFARVVANRSMSAAARELGLQPAIISKRIKRLEDRLGTRLFQRTTRQISLTEA